MMRSHVRRVVDVVLVLSGEEAMWLRDAMQNPLCGSGLEEEDERDADIRRGVFQTLSDELKKLGVG